MHTLSAGDYVDLYRLSVAVVTISAFLPLEDVAQTTPDCGVYTASVETARLFHS